MKLGKRSVIPLWLAVAALFGIAIAQTRSGSAIAPYRPKILGVANISLRSDDLETARKFYGEMLGFAEPLAFTDGVNGSAMRAYFKVNDHQYIQVTRALDDPRQDRLIHIGFETDNAEQLRAYMAGHGVAGVPEHVTKMQDESRGFEVQDPDGHIVEFVEYTPESKLAANFGKYLAEDRISRRMIHVGVVVRDRAAADRFYKDILGFKEIWHGGMTDDTTDWVDMRVPDGTDWLEYMLNVHNPDPRTLGVMHHLALGVPDVRAAYKSVLRRGLKPAEKPQVGRDGKWQLNLYDPNYTRVELMEPKPVKKPCCSPMLQ